jgi:hypothetical protein
MEAVVILKLSFGLGNSRANLLALYTFSCMPGRPMTEKKYVFNSAQVRHQASA